MERLTNRNDDGSVEYEDVEDALSYGMYRLADYEDAEEQGRLIEYPVAIGDRIWVIQKKFGIKNINGYKITSLGIDGSNGKMYAGVFAGDIINGEFYDLGEFGKTIFATYAEAEAKLKEMEGSDAKNHEAG